MRSRVPPFALAALALILFSHPSPAADPVVEDEVVAGGPGDFMEVRHLVLRGSNFAIGRKLAEIARDRHGARPAPSSDPQRTRARRQYYARVFPAFLERMRGAAAAFEVELEDDRHELSMLGYPRSRPGCSVVYYPPDRTTRGEGILSRNYDFSTGTLRGQRPPAGSLAATARPYVIELYPEKGYASLYLCSYDLLGGTIDGINSEGLTAALLADDELLSSGQADPAGGTGVGFGVAQILRYVLETCADVDEAKEALLTAKLYYSFIPCHYIIADRHGRSFVWEHSFGHNREHIIDGGGKPQITTNFLLHRHPRIEDFPSEKHPLGSFNRYRAIHDRLVRSQRFDLDAIKAINACVSPDPETAPMPPSGVTGRTLWHALYYPDRRALDIDFYLRDEPARAGGATSRIVRSGYLSFSLNRP